MRRIQLLRLCTRIRRRGLQPEGMGPRLNNGEEGAKRPTMRICLNNGEEGAERPTMRIREPGSRRTGEPGERTQMSSRDEANQTAAVGRRRLPGGSRFAVGTLALLGAMSLARSASALQPLDTFL